MLILYLKPDSREGVGELVVRRLAGSGALALRHGCVLLIDACLLFILIFLLRFALGAFLFAVLIIALYSETENR